MIKITIRGQLYRDEDSASYSFPQNENKKWQTCISNDPRIILQKLGCQQCYAIWQNSNGIYYAFYRHLPTRAGADAALIVALCDIFIADGTSFLYQLKNILDYCIDKKTSREIDNQIIAEKVNELERCFTSYQITPNDLFSTINQSLPDAYRTFSNENDLKEIIENPLQSTYQSISTLYIIDESNNIPIHLPLQKITDKVRHCFFIRENIGAIANRTIVLEGDTFNVTYSKQGYNELTLRFRTISNPKYFLIESNEIILHSAEEAGIDFKKSYTFHAKNKNSNEDIDDWKISIKEQTFQCDKDQLTLELPDGEHIIKVSAPGYKEAEFTFNTNEPSKRTFPLEPRRWSSQKIWLITPNKEEKNSPVEITANENSDIAHYLTRNVNNGINNFYINSKNIKKTPFWVFPLLVALGLLIGFFLGNIDWKKANNKSTTQEDVPELDEVKTLPSIEETNPDPEELDLSYLNNNELWVIDSLKSEKWKLFLMDEMIKNNKIIEEHPEITNDNYRIFYRLKNTDAGKEIWRNKRKQKDLFTDTATYIDIHQAAETLSKSGNGNHKEDGGFPL